MASATLASLAAAARPITTSRKVASRRLPQGLRLARAPLRALSTGAPRPSRPPVRCVAAGSPGAGEGASTSTARQPATLTWSPATVVENRAESADGVVRTLVLSVEDEVPYLDGRKRKHVQQRARWIDSYKQPGQKVSLRFPDAEGDKPLTTLAIASSPYQTHAKSADFAAGIIEVLVEHGANEAGERLANLSPGAELQVSNVMGMGFGSLFNKDVGLAQTLEDGKSILMIAQGTEGIAPIRSALESASVQAHATEYPVSLVYLCKNRGSAAYLKDWDVWREAGINVKTVYFVEEEEGGTDMVAEEAVDKLAFTIYNSENGLAGTIGGNPADCTVLMAGMEGKVALSISRRLVEDGVPRDQIWAF
mmetsp:Transcript_13018/g.32942  ORF Transcript_13018/g.32942 Transcript_13018/m.32942 type:complete len:365 (-) Transcript_13018:151-1245(-)|eukprot:jgi/Tetstr1/466185/TSEL_010745.t1